MSVPALPTAFAASLPVGGADSIRDGRAPSRQPLPPILWGLDGVWDGTRVDTDLNALAPFIFRLRVARDGSLSVSTPSMTPIRAELLDANDTRFAVAIGPYRHPEIDAALVTHVHGRRVGNRIWGTYETRPATGGGAAARGSFAVMRSRLANQ